MNISACLANISLVQSHLMEELWSSHQPPPPTQVSLIPIGYLHILIGSASTPQPHPPAAVPPPTWGSQYSKSPHIPYTLSQVIGYPLASP
ncbi:hypothetical protein C1H46_019212 [Malus baccata]|uniref:Uncharacterized protein n=1 Tax=Malus baccata TaxID=106549 RepID=A0A540M9Q4_MALBA|nr:hypothetical protein C1H46_019212 [Malus baccata]